MLIMPIGPRGGRYLITKSGAKVYVKDGQSAPTEKRAASPAASGGGDYAHALREYDRLSKAGVPHHEASRALRELSSKSGSGAQTQSPQKMLVQKAVAAKAAQMGVPKQPAAPPAPSKPTAAMTDDEFVSHVHKTAKSLISRQNEEERDNATRSFGDDKAFISAVHEHGGFNMPLDQFKARLVGLHRERKLTLSRADLVEAMHPASVAKSHTQYNNANFHFVKLT